ncbi:heme exporter protein CcmB [Marinomonas rhizomae]|uniref:Heme exporter protein B n=1 Tax=Marinomonas rhizomae TaxID=491948 RepID=A0A366J6H6_9GAMM|nr:heme exporter protein CcmB [Marinomonas rhizomae]RBP81805.1 heme exporter protein B [Marinomonas rhizomae]RNF72926.1 heme exporter protein CcmB [Marinomonas rhizomae]
MTYSSFIRSEFLVLWRRKQDIFNALLFFIIVVALFPIGINSSAEFLAPAAAGIVWCAVMLAILMAVEGMFKEDYWDGSLEQWIVSGLSLPLLILLKVIVQWLVVVAPLLVMMPLFSEMLYLPSLSFWVLIMTLLLGSPSLFFIGAVGAALTMSIKQGAVLVMLLILPFYLPVIIFSTLAVKAAEAGLPYSGLLAMLLAMSLLSLVISPLMTAIAVKASVN